MCEVCVVPRLTIEQKVDKEIKEMISYNLSDAYIEAVMYGRYSYKYSIGEINSKIVKNKLG